MSGIGVVGPSTAPVGASLNAGAQAPRREKPAAEILPDVAPPGAPEMSLVGLTAPEAGGWGAAAPLDFGPSPRRADSDLANVTSFAGPPDPTADGSRRETGTNTAITPGWPPRAALSHGGPGAAAMTDEEMFAHLAALGIDADMIGNLRKSRDKSGAAKKTLKSALALFAALTTALDSVGDEIAAALSRAVENDEDERERRRFRG